MADGLNSSDPMDIVMEEPSAVTGAPGKTEEETSQPMEIDEAPAAMNGTHVHLSIHPPRPSIHHHHFSVSRRFSRCTSVTQSKDATEEAEGEEDNSAEDEDFELVCPPPIQSIPLASHDLCAS